MRVGLILPMSDDDGQGTPPWPVVLDRARQAEAGGADSIWVYDHLLLRLDAHPTGSHEAWTLLAALAAATGRVALGTIVLATSFRSPAVLAKMATTLDEISSGRLILGLGCGWHEPEYAAFGFPFDHRVDRFEESLRIISPLIREGAVTFVGTYHRAEDCLVLPRGPRERIPILVAAKGPRMLRLAAEQRLADLRAACVDVGRDPATLEITVGVTVRAAGEEEWGGPGAPASIPGEPEVVADALRAYAALGVGHVQLDVQPATEATFDRVLDGVRRFRL
jgi:alkanesulfonate monooxygenase SsuD/methylene tetrahydromethanopterin reductase-like flavin-dependent oxidoreductase (luciferase family)